MRIRPPAVLSIAVLSALLLAGCSGSAEPDTESSPSASAVATDLCSVAAPSGDVASSVTVSGEVGQSPEVDFAAPLEVTSAERVVAVEGDGPAIAEGDYVSYALAVYDATTGTLAEETGFDGAAATPVPVTVGSGGDTFFGCATEGSRLVVAVPASDGAGGPYVYVIDVVDVIPSAEWCVATEPGDQFPTATFSEDGVPTISVPAAEPPADVQLQVLSEGDGDVVESGDTVTVNYTGVKWSDGTVFDSSWESGQPATFETTGVVAGFQRALEGQTVGSTVMVVIPPACGYGEGEINTTDLTGETLVFVVNIVDTVRP